MKSQTLPPEMRDLAHALPIVSVKENGETLPFVSLPDLHLLTGAAKPIMAWTARWVVEHCAWVEDGIAPDVGPPVRFADDGATRLIHAPLAATMALNSHTEGGPALSDYITFAERRWRILDGHALTAAEVAAEYGLDDPRPGSKKRIGDSLAAYAAHASGAPQVMPLTHGFATRAFPSGLVEDWFRNGGGAAFIEAERARPKQPKKPAKPRKARYTNADIEAWLEQDAAEQPF